MDILREHLACPLYTNASKGGLISEGVFTVASCSKKQVYEIIVCQILNLIEKVDGL